MPEQHIYADFMAQYEQDAQETDKPWERWQYLINTDCKGKEYWMDAFDGFCFSSKTKYRRKQKTININGFEVPEPLRIEPKNGTSVWCALNDYEYRYENDTGKIKDWFINGVLHDNKKSSEIHNKALLSFTTQKK